MQLVTLLAGVALFPFFGLGFLLWMARLEDSLPEAVRRAARRPDPAPILTIPVRSARAGETMRVIVPGQRQASDVALSTEPSFGGSTNR